MGLEKSPAFYSRNGFIYVFSKTDGKWYEIRETNSLPHDVKVQVKELQETADTLKESLN